MNYRLFEPLLPLNNEMTTVERILTSRGIKDVQHYLNTTDDDILNPLLLKNVPEGAKMLVQHLKNRDKMLIIVDCDPDGYTSAALFINYLNMIAPGYTQNYVTWRLHEGKEHGLQDCTDFIKSQEDLKFVVIPDAASNDYKQHKELKEQGIDILILDHHEADKVSEDACIINNQLCDYPTKSLSGVAITWKFCCYIDSLMDTKYAQDLLDLVSVGLCADMMDIRDFETKHLIQKGLQNIRNPFLKEMFKKQSVMINKRGGMSPFNVSYYIVPLINASIRVGTQEEKQILFESMIDFLGYELIPSTKRGCKGQFEPKVEQACRNCTNIKKRQTDSKDICIEKIEDTIKEKNLLDNQILLIQMKPETQINKNITGLIANGLMAKYQRPTLLLTQTIGPTGDIMWSGSGRGCGLESFREFITNSGFAIYAQGHASAFGASFRDSNIQSFIDYSNKVLAGYDFTPCEKVDFIWQEGDFKKYDVIAISELKPLEGQNVQGVQVVVENVKITSSNISVLAHGTIKISLSNGVEVMKFKCSEEELENLVPKDDFTVITINILGTCNINCFNGNITPQIQISDYEILSHKYDF